MNKFWQMKIWQPPKFIGFKVFAVLLAVLIWGYVMIIQNPLTEDTFVVPVEIENPSAKLAVSETTRQITVRVQGNSKEINSLTSHNIKAYVDFSGIIEPGEITLPIIVELPEGITLVSQSLDTMTFIMEPVVSENFNLETRIIGEPDENFIMLDPELNPARITLSGAEAYINMVDRVFVTVDVSGISESYNAKLSVEVLDFSGNNISQWFTCIPSTAEVLVPIVDLKPEKNVAVNVPVIGKPAIGYQVSRVVVEPSVVRAFGDISLLNSLYYLETNPIDVTDLEEDKRVTVTINRDPGISLSTNTVTVIIQIEPVSISEFTKELLYYQHLAEGLVCNLPAIDILIRFSGAETHLSAVTASDVVPYIDFSGITEPGEYTLPIKVNLPANIGLVDTSPGEITVMVNLLGDETGLSSPEGTEPPVGGETSGNTENSESKDDEN